MHTKKDDDSDNDSSEVGESKIEHNDFGNSNYDTSMISLH